MRNVTTSTPILHEFDDFDADTTHQDLAEADWFSLCIVTEAFGSLWNEDDDTWQPLYLAAGNEIDACEAYLELLGIAPVETYFPF
jgi:hypothetical protein